jgi:hypothetical protein
MQEKYFVNLTNGIELIPEIPRVDGFIRIQSTWCEQHLWDDLLRDLDYTFLLYLALGYTCYVYDTSRHNTSRAIYQGLEFIKYVLYKVWFKKNYIPNVRGINTSKYFFEEYKKLSSKTLSKIKYFRMFLKTDTLKIIPVCKYTTHDSDYSYYVNILQKHF